MTLSKRLFDIALALVLGTFLILPLFGLCLVLLIKEGRPVFYISERMNAPERAFGLVKLRTMRPAEQNTGVTGGDKSGRSSALQNALRSFRLDEIPQLWNVLRGDMSFVGPRPPLRIYTEDYPELYRSILQNRPGLTGLASLEFHAREASLLRDCRTAEETDAVYRRRCIPRKARLDLIYQAHSNFCYDLNLLGQTFWRIFTAK